MILLPAEVAAQTLHASDINEPVVVFDRVQDVSPEVLARARFYVPEYLGPADAFAAMAAMPALQVCQLPTAGYEHAAEFVPAGVTLCNAAGVHDASTAELLVGLLLARLRHIDDMARAMSSGTWLSGRFTSLADKHVVIIGFGGVGQAVAARLAAFEVTISPVARRSRLGVHTMADLDRLLPQADAVILTVPLTPDTHHLVNAEFLQQMKRGAVLVNGARGPVVDADALLDALCEGRVQAALDVTDPEPLPPDHPLWQAPGVLISPHVGGNSSAFVPRMSVLVAAQIRRWQEGVALKHVVMS